MLLNDPAVSYNSLDDRNVLSIISMIRKGIRFSQFMQVVKPGPFALTEWSSILHLSERTLQRYEAENASFDPIQSEKIVQVTMLTNFGVQVFGNRDKFHSWLSAPSVALGRIAPRELLDNSFGIEMVKDELGRMQHGVLA